MARRIAVIGTGYVGLVTAIGLADFGNRVIAVDADRRKIERLQAGVPTLYEPGIDEYLRRNTAAGRISFGTSVDEAVKASEVVFNTVGTPSGDNGEADLSQVIAVADSVGRHLDSYKVVVTKSTVPVGTNREIKKQLRRLSGNDGFDVVSNPEFVREGRAFQDFFHPDRVVIGYESENAKSVMTDVYRPLYLIQTPFLWCNLETAELVKYASNAFLATKITFVNQIANLAEVVGADIHVVARAMGMDGRIGPKFLHPGPGFGGSCLPKDTRALASIGDQYGVDMSLVKETIRANERHKLKVIQKLERLAGSLDGKVIAVLGLAFKAETDDVRESPAITVVEQLLSKDATVRAHDPKAMANFRKLFPKGVEFFDDEFEAARGAHALVFCTEWNAYRNIDLERIARLMKEKIILDLRNLLDVERARSEGFVYEGMGRKKQP